MTTGAPSSGSGPIGGVANVLGLNHHGQVGPAGSLDGLDLEGEMTTAPACRPPQPSAAIGASATAMFGSEPWASNVW
jgi:hypothetical protein